MNIRHIARHVALLSIAAFTLGACNSGTTNLNNTANSNNTSNSSANKETKAPSTARDYSTPTATIKSFYEAAKANDIEEFKRSMSKKALDSITAQAASDKKSLDDALKEIIKDASASPPETRNEKIDGDKATIETKDDKMTDWTTVHLVKEDGQWKLTIAENSSMDKMDHSAPNKK